MINPLQYYTCAGRPLGVVLALAMLIVSCFGHVWGFLAGNDPLLASILAVTLFVFALTQLLRRRISALVLGTAFFLLSMYASAAHPPGGGAAVTALWWLISLLGIAGLVSNRRWYDERMIRLSF